MELDILDENDLKKMKKAELVSLCIERNCSEKGVKADLIANLLATNPEPVETLPLPDESTILNIIENSKV